ncbi:MAG: MFS transporter [Candidatus Sigynarchaeum springense]
MKQSEVAKRRAMLSINMTFLLSILGGIGIGVNSFCTSTLTELLARGLSMDDGEAGFWVGMVATGFGITYCISPVILGHLSDRIGRRASLACAMLGFAATNVVVFFLAAAPIHLVVANVFTGLCYGLFWPPIEAYLSEMTEYISQKLHARSLSIYLVCWSIGLTVGPFVGSVFDAAGGVRYGFVMLAAVAVIAMLLALKFVFAKGDVAAFKAKSVKVDVVISDRINRAKGRYLVYLKVAIAFSAIYFAFTNQILQRIFPALAKQGYMNQGMLFASWDPSLTAGTLIFFLGIGRTLTLWHAGVMSAKAREQMLLGFAIGIPVANLFIYLFPVADALLVSFTVYGLFNGYAYCIGIILLMELSKTGKGLRAGVYEAAIGIGFLASTFTSGIVIPIDPSLPFLLGTLVATCLTTVLLVMFYLSKSPRQITFRA